MNQPYTERHQQLLSYQCLAGLSLYFCFSSSGTGESFCLARAVLMISSWSLGGGTWSQAFWLQTSASEVRNLAYATMNVMPLRGTIHLRAHRDPKGGFSVFTSCTEDATRDVLTVLTSSEAIKP